MKKLLLSFLLCSSFIGFAQDWNPFPLGQKSYFTHENYRYNTFLTYENDSSIHEYKIDTIINNITHQTLHFNYKIDGINDCIDNILPAWNFYYNYHDNSRPDSIISRGDSLIFYYNDYQGNNQQTFVFKPLTSLNNSWESTFNGSGFDRLKITCESLYYDTIIGSITDSIKSFSIEAFQGSTPVASVYDSQNFILTKNYGFIHFFNIPLIGLTKDSISEGYQPPSLSDYFNLDVGDIIIWREHFRSFDGWSDITIYYKDSIDGKFSSTDSIYYSIHRINHLGVQSPYVKEYTKNNILSLLNSSTCSFIPESNYNPNNIKLHETSPYFLSNNNILHKSEIYEGKTLNQSNCGFDMISDIFIWNMYNTKYGIFYYGNVVGWVGITRDTIIGSTINGIQEGVMWSTLVTGVNSFENNPTINIYPNPSASGNFVLESEAAKLVEIMSIDGKTVFTQTINQPKTEIKTGLPKGLYFVKVTFENKKVTTQKLIITQ
jgi:hypothetical protein